MADEKKEEKKEQVVHDYVFEILMCISLTCIILGMGLIATHFNSVEQHEKTRTLIENTKNEIFDRMNTYRKIERTQQEKAQKKE